jgi:hypothetical protein
MNKKILYLIIATLAALPVVSCNYLDRREETSGYTFDTVFGDSVNYRNFCEYLVLEPIIRYQQNGVIPHGSFDDITDNSISTPTYGCASMLAQSGNYLQMRGVDHSPMANNVTWGRAWTAIRIANEGINHIELYPGSEASRNKILGLCYFYRAFAYHELVRRWGGMPYFFEAITDFSAALDYERLDMRDTYLLIAADCDEAAKYLANEIPLNEWQHPTRVAALALKSRVLLYAASAQATNEAGVSRESLWEEAALAADAAIRAAEDNNYGLVDMDHYYYLFKGQDYQYYTKEVLFGRRAQIAWGSDAYRVTMRPPGKLNGSYGVAVNQTLVDSYEMQATGLPVSDPGSGYVEQDPYKGRDPRFYHDIIHNGSEPYPGYKMDLCNRVEGASAPGGGDILYESGQIVQGYTTTGTYMRKWMGNVWNAALPQVWPYIRLSEVYLNFAEAANEAWGSATTRPECRYSALEALNKVRNRAQMPDLPEKFHDKDMFRERTRNERRVELCFEEHRLFDIRRWQIATMPEYRDIWKVEITRLAAPSEEYPTGYKYEKKLHLTRVFEEKHYLFPIKDEDVEVGEKFDQNPGW